MSADQTSNSPVPRSGWSCCFVAGLGASAVVFLLVFSLWWTVRQQDEKLRIDRWESQVADVKSGTSAELTISDDKLFVEFVQNEPDVAAKVSRLVIQTLGSRPGRVADERFDDCVRQLPRLESIVFDETCDDISPLLARLDGKKSITSLSFYMTYITDDGMRSVAAFPNLKHLHVDGHWNKLNWEPLRSHKEIESLVWEDARMTEEQAKVLASWPKLQSLNVEIPDDDFQKLKKALPRVKEMSNSMK